MMRVKILQNWLAGNGKEYIAGQELTMTESDRLTVERWLRNGTAVLLEDTKPPEPRKKDRLPPVTRTGKLELLDFKHFDKLKKEKNFVIDGIIRPKTINQLFSPPEHMKSIIAQYMGVCVSNGREWLGLKTKKGGVLIIDRENNEDTIKERWTGLRNGLKLHLKKAPMFYLIDSPGILDEKFIAELCTIIQERKIVFVVMDTLRRLGDFDENSSNDINRIFDKCFKPIVSAGASILFLHHSDKTGAKYRGSSDLLGLVDTSWSISKTPENVFTINCIKNRRGVHENIAGKLEIIGDSWEINPLVAENLPDAGKFSIQKAITRHIVAILNPEGEPISLQDIKYALDEANIKNSKSSIQRSLSYLKRIGKIKALGNGNYSMVAT